VKCLRALNEYKHKQYLDIDTMAVVLDAFRVKHLMKVSDPLKVFCDSKLDLNNGIFYVLKLENTFHYDAIKHDNFTLYKKYVEETKQTEHTVEKFQTLIRNFDVDKIEKIQARIQAHSDFYWVFDGAHRLCILKYKQLFGNTIPLKYIDLNFFDCVQKKMRELLKNTVNKPLENGWNNRTEFGYHSFDIFNIHIPGQRSPIKRFQKIKKYYDFSNKKVLDLGCNTGGMLFHIPEISHGIGVDLDDRCLEACAYFRKYLRFACRLDFFKNDLNKINVPMMCHTLNFQPDIIFLLSLGSWISNWKQLYEDCFSVSKTILLETNNDKEGYAQIVFFLDKGARITCVSVQSDDDITGNLGRKTYLIEKI
jgi:SAM-dependent methyltransferase